MCNVLLASLYSYNLVLRLKYELLIISLWMPAHVVHEGPKRRRKTHNFAYITMRKQLNNNYSVQSMCVLALRRWLTVASGRHYISSTQINLVKNFQLLLILSLLFPFFVFHFDLAFVRNKKRFHDTDHVTAGKNDCKTVYVPSIWMPFTQDDANSFNFLLHVTHSRCSASSRITNRYFITSYAWMWLRSDLYAMNLRLTR